MKTIIYLRPIGMRIWRPYIHIIPACFTFISNSPQTLPTCHPTVVLYGLRQPEHVQLGRVG
ncbi:hypothetical protein JB92DRAFT_2905090 [Gautieria morchelliformis]|nr:hypothetical protein JB92DRAFT_2905090 [Gautieria morchelliformis]